MNLDNFPDTIAPMQALVPLFFISTTQASVICSDLANLNFIVEQLIDPLSWLTSECSPALW